MLLDGMVIKFDIMPCKRAFYSACNCIFMYGSDVDELALLSLQESYNHPILMYAVPALSLKSKQLDELNVCWNNVVRKLFNYNKWESVKSVLFNLGRLNVTHFIMIRKINFYRHVLTSKSSTLYNVFMSFLSSGHDDMRQSVFITKSSAITLVKDSFELYVSS